MHSRTITLRPGETFVTADGVTVEARTEEQECREQASLGAIEKARADTAAELVRSAGLTRLSRAVSITDLDDRLVIEVGAAELRLTKEEAASLFSIGSVYARKPQA